MAVLFLLSLSIFCGACAGQYTPDWDSIDSRPLPQWYDDCKIGIFMHFGPYAVPGLRSEWFWSDWMSNASDVTEFMSTHYPKNFAYQDFGPELKMEFFNASWFADLVEASGAKYLVFKSKHHDGYTNWPSPYTFGWNSMDVGPKKDVLGELKTAFSKHPDLHFGVYYSLFEWYNPMYLRDKANGFTTREYVQHKMFPEMQDLITNYSPDVLWVDGDWESTPEYFGSQHFLAWLYNDSPSRDTIVTNDRWGQGTQMKHGGFYSGPDKFNPGVLIRHKFEDAMTVDSHSWGVRRNIHLDDIVETESLIHLVASIVSCNGNILINVGPTKEGTIYPIFEERLRQLGGWLKTNGEAIYATRPWIHQNDSLAQDPQVWYTSKGQNVYAISLGWPKSSTLVLGDITPTSTTKAHLLGYEGQPLKFATTDDQGKFAIKFPAMDQYVDQCGKFCNWAYVVKITGIQNSKIEVLK